MNIKSSLRMVELLGALGIAVLVTACANVASNSAASNSAARCDDGIKTSFKPDALTSVIAVRQIRQGEELVTVDGTTKAAADMCLVKILVGPGNPGPVGAPSTTAGIGIEVWLPTPANWNERIRNYGGGGWVGGGHLDPAKIGSKVPASVNANIGYAVGTTDAGQPAYQDGSFILNSDGTRNERSLQDYSYRSLYELAVKTKALVKLYYGREPRYSYFDGQSTGGRQVLQVAQEFPELYDGYMVAAPAINLTRFGVSAFYPQMVMKMDLGFTAKDTALAAAFKKKIEAVTARAVSACDKEGLGFILDPFQCSYDPAKDAAALCAGEVVSGVTGTNANSAVCVSGKEALAINKMWFGPSIDGSFDANQTPDARSGKSLGHKQLWWGLTRGSDITDKVVNAGATDWLALLNQDASYAATAIKFVNASTSVRDKWTQLDYAGFTDAYILGLTLQPNLSYPNADKPDLSKLRDLGRKIVIHHGLGEDVIPPAGTVNYYNRVAQRMGGMTEVQKFARLYLTPGVAHSSQGRAYTVSGKNNTVPIPKLPGVNNQTPSPEQDQMFTVLLNWVEKGQAPGQIIITSRDNTVSYPICVYPQKTTYSGSGSSKLASSYVCQ
jgi:Tannase and feruloyl esterase